MAARAVISDVIESRSQTPGDHKIDIVVASELLEGVESTRHLLLKRTDTRLDDDGEYRSNQDPARGAACVYS